MLDKILLNSAVLLNIKEDTHLKSSWEFTWINSIFYFGYLTGTPIHVYFLQHLPLSYYVSGIVTVWGVVVALHAACHDYGGLLTVRFFLGLFEAAITPGLILMTGRFYTRREQMIRTVIWFSFNGWAFIFAGIITYGILRQGEPAHIKKWQELYIILGVLTFSWGILCFSLCQPRQILPSISAKNSVVLPFIAWLRTNQVSTILILNGPSLRKLSWTFDSICFFGICVHLCDERWHYILQQSNYQRVRLLQ